MADAATGTRRLSPNAIGALWMLASGAAFTVMAALLKILAARDYPETQMLFFRCAAGIVAIAPFLLTGGVRTLAVARPWTVLRRCAFSSVGLFTAIYAFANMPVADAQAITFSRALFIAVLAAWLLKERVDWRRWTAVGVGFAGVLLMLRPSGAPQTDLAALAAVASAFLLALTLVTVKDLTRDHSTLALVAWTNIFTTAVGIPFAFMAWQPPAPMDWVLFLAMGFAGVATQSCFTRALAHADVSLMGLVDYVRLPMAVALGLVLFHEVPGTMTLVGATIIIASTLYITMREARPPRR